MNAGTLNPRRSRQRRIGCKAEIISLWLLFAVGRMAWREHAVSLISLANRHSDLTVKLSSLKQAKDILLSVEPAFAAELFPYMVELQHSPEPLVRRVLLEAIEEISWKYMEHLPIFAPIMVAFLRDIDHRIVKHCIVIGTHLYSNVLTEMSTQLKRRGKLDWWVEELWKWLRRFRDSVLEIALQPGPMGAKILALKFLETNVLLFTPEPNDYSKVIPEGKKLVFNISWLPHNYPNLNPMILKSDANKILGILLNFLQPSSTLPGSLVIAVVNSLAVIARKRPSHYGIILSALLDYKPSFDNLKRWHAVSVQYSIRTAFLGFLRSTLPEILETREKLLRALRMMNAGEAADQVVRQVEKMIKINERASRERIARDEVLSNQDTSSWDQSRKRYEPIDEELDNHQEILTKRMRFSANTKLNKSLKVNGSEVDIVAFNGPSATVPVLDSDLSPAEKMIAMIGALLAEGDRGAESLELLISTFHPDLLADIVILNMKHLPKAQPLVTGLDSVATPYQSSTNNQVQTTSLAKSQLAVPLAQETYPPVSGVTPASDVSAINHLSIEAKRDPRRDPRRLDPRRVQVVSGTTSELPGDEPSLTHDSDTSSVPVLKSFSESTIANSSANKDEETARGDMLPSICDQGILKGVANNRGKNSTVEGKHSSSHSDPKELESVGRTSVLETDDDNQADLDCDEPPLSPSASNTSATDDGGQGFPELPQYVEMTEKQQKVVGKLSIERMIESYIYLSGNSCNEIRLTLLSRFIALNNADDDIVDILQNHIAIDYGLKKGHDLVLHVLYQLYSLMVQDSDESSHATAAYEKILLAVAKSLLDIFPASDKSFSRLLNEVPVLPDSVFKLLDDLCSSDVVDHSQAKEVRDGERVTQGLGAVWGLILGRPNSRQTCLDIALKCASHLQDDIRAKAIRLVANKLYPLLYIATQIEDFATSLLFKVVNHHSSEADALQLNSFEQRSETAQAQARNSQEPDVKSEPCSTDNTQTVVQSAASLSLPEAQRHISLYFALCTKKPRLLRLIFDVYGRSPKTVKQVIHRHVPIVIKSMGSSYAELLHIMADPPDGCENLLILVLQILTENGSPSKELIETVKHWFETKVKDAMILIPILSSLSKDEVLPVFPRLLNLPIEKFQVALAHILQGSAHTGPALTPAEVLVAIHDINPERDGLPLKKITDACTTCFEQRTVFTQHVLEKALNHMIDQTPLPLLFMRTVIQAIDAFPSLVDFVMEILSKLVSRQVWKMPKLWVGFLKCAAQTRPHSFPVLLQLPAQQLETALAKHPNLKSPLASYAGQPSVKATLPRPMLVVLGLTNQPSIQAPHAPPLETAPGI